MKCLSVKQPWATFQISGKQKIESRRYDTPHRGSLLIHASGIVDKEACEKFKVEPKVTGAILGYVKLASVEKASVERWKKTRDEHLVEGNRLFGNSTFLWHYKGHHKFPEPIPYQGTQGLFDVPGTILPLSKIVIPKISLETFKDILPIICDKDISYDPEGWTPENPLWGHSAIVALLAQRLFGGELFKVSLTDDPDLSRLKSHYWNQMPDGTEIDFTEDQFNGAHPKKEKSKIEHRPRAYVLRVESTNKRYKALEARLAKLFRFSIDKSKEIKEEAPKNTPVKVAG